MADESSSSSSSSSSFLPEGAFCTEADVVKRLRRELTSDEKTYLPGMIEEAQLLVVAHLGCGPDPYEDAEDIPDAVRIVTSRMVARVLQEAASMAPEDFGAIQAGETAGPFSSQRTFERGSRLGSPWLAKADKDVLADYSCANRAFSVDTAPLGGSIHAATCSAIAYRYLEHWQAYCTCGADIAGEPIYGTDGD